MVKFRAPGLGANDFISFSKDILSGDASITNDDLCKAKITYMFSDGYVTTSNLRPCPAGPLPLIASSWRPDPHGCAADRQDRMCSSSTGNPAPAAVHGPDRTGLPDAGAPRTCGLRLHNVRGDNWTKPATTAFPSATTPRRLLKALPLTINAGQ